MVSKGMRMESLTATKQWRALSPTIKRIMTLYFQDRDRSLPDAIGSYFVNMEETYRLERQRR